MRCIFSRWVFGNTKRGVPGFTLVEVIAAVGIFVIFAVGIYSAISLSIKIAIESRRRVVETGLVNEQLETARNLKYDDVGILGGSPPGKLVYQKMIQYNGATYQITTTVRNIDDPYDGTIDGATKDAAPADYKLVEMSVVCTSCASNKPLVLSTRVSPKNLEGASTNGSLFLQLFDAAGLPVSGVNVAAINNAVNPPVVINDTTGIDGYLRLIDIPTGTLAYSISATKAGYSTDYTVASSMANPQPSTPPATVISQTVTELSLSIDRISSLNVHAVNQACQPLSNTPLRLVGQKLIGKNPKIYKFDQLLSTDAFGLIAFPAIEWDTYTVSASGTALDLAGAIPAVPFGITPGSAQELTAVLRPHSAHTLLVRVQDAGTMLPLADATVELTRTGYTKTLLTTMGYIRQTDWSQGAGQANFGNEARYYSDDAGVDTEDPAGDLKLKKVGMQYVESGLVESSTFDLGTGVTFRNLVVEPSTQPPQTGNKPLLFQLATSAVPDPGTWNFVGPNGVTSTFYTPTSTVIFTGHSGDRYLRYQALLHSDSSNYTPQLSELSVTYTNACTPPGQAFFASLPTAGAYTLTVTRNGYTTATGQIDLGGNRETTVNMSAL